METFRFIYYITSLSIFFIYIFFIIYLLMKVLINYINEKNINRKIKTKARTYNTNEIVAFKKPTDMYQVRTYILIGKIIEKQQLFGKYEYTIFTKIDSCNSKVYQISETDIFGLANVKCWNPNVNMWFIH